MSAFPDLVVELVRWARRQSGVAGSNNETPAPGVFEASLNFVRFSRLGGGRDEITDSGTVDIDVFAADRNAAEVLANQLVDALTPRTRLDSAIIDTVRITTSPRQLPWSDNIKRFSATLVISTRR